MIHLIRKLYFEGTTSARTTKEKSLDEIVGDLIESVEEEEGFKKYLYCDKKHKVIHNLKKHIIKEHKTRVPHQWLSEEDVMKEYISEISDRVDNFKEAFDKMNKEFGVTVTPKSATTKSLRQFISRYIKE